MSHRRKLTAVDDPLADSSRPIPRQAPSATETVALYVRLPPADADRLARAAFELRVHKRELVAALIATHVDGSTDAGRQVLETMLASYRELSR